MAKSTQNLKDTNQKNKTPTKQVGALSRQKKYKDDKLIEEKKQKSSHKIILFFLFLVLLGLMMGIIFSPTFNVTGVVVEDGENVNSAEISNIVNVKLGENILKQDYSKMKSEVMSLPYIESAVVKPLFPNKVSITYEERKPYMILKYLESFFVMDKQGYLLEITKENNRADLPIVYGVEIDSYTLGEKIGDTSRIKYQNIVTLLDVAESSHFPYEIYEINYESIREVKLWVKGFDIDIIYGEINKNSISDRLNYLSQILENLKNKKGKLNMSSENYLEKTIFTEIH